MTDTTELNDHFRLTTQENAWVTGHFKALDDLPVEHVVCTRKGLDVHFIRNHMDQAVQQVAQALNGKDGAWLNQVHGPAVLSCDSRGCIGDADGLCTNRPGLVLVGKSADCPLILVAENQGRAVGFAHASWRSTVAGVTFNLIKSMTQALGCHPENLVACICPSAGPECYEVGPEVREAALSQLGLQAKTFFTDHEDKFLFDLWQANTHALQQCGLSPSNIHCAGVCTLCRNDLFPSYRKEGDRAGRFVAAICL